jgi:ribosomal protein S17
MRGRDRTSIIGIITSAFDGRTLQVLTEDKKYKNLYSVLVGKKLEHAAKLAKEGDLVEVEGPQTPDKKHILAKEFNNFSATNLNKGDL